MQIYLITNLINNKIYIGQTVVSKEKRLENHFREALYRKRENDRAINKAIRKYGKKNFIIEQIDSATSQEELNLKEILWINYLDSHVSSGKGYNISFGGKGTGFLSAETKQKISNKIKGRKYGPYTDERKKRISESLKGKKWTEQQKLKNKNIDRNPSKGSKCNLAKLTESQVLEIRKSDLPYYQLAKIYNTGLNTIYNIKRRITWKHI